MATPPSKLSQILNPTSAAAPPSRILPRVLSAGRRGELVELPGIGKAWLELLGAVVDQDVYAEAVAAMATRGLQLTVLTGERFLLELAYRTLARAARDPDDQTTPLGSVDDWGMVDSARLNAAWHVFDDVRERLDPVASALSDDDRAAIAFAVKKKDAMLLRTYGTVKLSGWLASTDVLPSTSLPPSSPSSVSSPATDPPASPL